MFQRVDGVCGDRIEILLLERCGKDTADENKDQETSMHIERITSLDTARTRELIDRQVEATDAAIDLHVFELYGPTDQEVRIVEGTYPAGYFRPAMVVFNGHSSDPLPCAVQMR